MCGVAFLCAELSIRGELEYPASYLQNWLGVLKQDRTALFRLQPTPAGQGNSSTPSSPPQLRPAA
jgi:antirestriction protein ArdC